MPGEADEALVRRLFEEVWNQKDAEAAKEIVHEHYSSIENQTFPSIPGPEAVAADLKLYESLYDQLTFEIENMISSDHVVWSVWQATGVSRHSTFVNRKGETVPRLLRAEGVSLTEVKDGKIAAHRFLWPRDPLFP